MDKLIFVLSVAVVGSILLSGCVTPPSSQENQSGIPGKEAVGTADVEKEASADSEESMENPTNEADVVSEAPSFQIRK